MQQGEARLLERQLTRRFGELPAWVRERLGSASKTDLEVWADGVLTARTLEAVFVGPPGEGN